METPGTSQRPVRRIILRMSPDQVTLAEQVAEALAERQLQPEPSGSQPNEPPQPSASPPPPPQFNAPGTPPTVQKLPRSRFVAQNQQVIALVNIDPYTIMQSVGVIGNQSNPILYSSPDTALVTNFMSDDMSDDMSGFSPIYHNDNGYYWGQSAEQSAGQSAGQRQDTIRDINEFLDSQGLGNVATELVYPPSSPPSQLRF